MTLNTDTAETIADTYGGGGTVSRMSSTGLVATSGGTYSFVCPSGMADGDLMVLVLSGNTTTGTWSHSGWTMTDPYSSTGRTIQAGWKIWHTGDPTTIPFTFLASFYFAFGYVLRGCDPTTPIVGVSHVYGESATSYVLPSITTPSPNCYLMASIVQEQTHTITPPSGWGNTGQGGGGPWGFGTMKAAPTAGATGTQTFTQTLSGKWDAIMIAFQPPAASSGSYYRWENATPVAFGWGYRLDPPNANSAYRNGMVEGGYRIEVRYPSANGGTLTSGEYQVKIMTNASVQEDVHQWSPSARPLVIVYPCEYTQEPSPGSTPVDTPPVSECTVTADLASIAAAICALKVQMSVLLNYDVYMTQLIGEMYGPHTAIVGQAQESIMAPLGQFTALALAAMSNYAPTGSTTRLIAAGVTGDWSGATLGGGILIEIQTMPGTTGHRESTPPLYEVNERARQLGWLTFGYDGMMTEHQQIVYTEQYIKAPTTVEALVWVHLMVGVTADVYEVTETYTPTVVV